MWFDCFHKLVCGLLALSIAHVSKHTLKTSSGTRAIRDTYGLVTLKYPHLAKLTEQVFVRSTWTRGQNLAGHARRSHWRTCSVDPQRNCGNQLAIPEQLTLQVALYIHDTVVRNGEPRRYSIIEKRMAMSDTWSRKSRQRRFRLS